MSLFQDALAGGWAEAAGIVVEIRKWSSRVEQPAGLLLGK